MCTGPSGCIPTDMKENGINVFSTLEECMYKCKKPDEPNDKPKYMCTGFAGCIPTEENGINVFSTLEECNYKCKNRNHMEMEMIRKGERELKDYLDSL